MYIDKQNNIFAKKFKKINPHKSIYVVGTIKNIFITIVVNILLLTITYIILSFLFTV